jgi:hypothetical protein
VVLLDLLVLLGLRVQQVLLGLRVRGRPGLPDQEVLQDRQEDRPDPQGLLVPKEPQDLPALPARAQQDPQGLRVHLDRQDRQVGRLDLQDLPDRRARPDLLVLPVRKGLQEIPDHKAIQDLRDLPEGGVDVITVKI